MDRHPPRSPILLIHGAFHGAWCWTEVLALLAVTGRPVVAVDLPGAGLRAADPPSFTTHDPAALRTAPSPVAALTADDVATDVARVLVDLHERHGAVTVVAHSVSGVVLHRLGEQYTRLVRQLVYVAACAPPPGVSPFADAAGEPFAASLFHQLLFADPGAVGAVRVDWRSDDPAYRDAARRFFFDDLPRERAEVALRMLTSDAPASIFADVPTLTAARWGSLPRTWLRCTRDLAVPPAAQTADITGLDAAFPERRFAVVDLDTGHSPFLSVPARLAEHLDALADRVPEEH